LILTLPLVALNPYWCRDQLRNCDTFIQLFNAFNS